VADILARIVARKKEELSEFRTDSAELRQVAAHKALTRREFARAIRFVKPAVIAEIKKASPSRGLLAADFDPAGLARQYENGGAAALSVLTDRDFFQGSLADLGTARAACALPVLRKDFTISEYHVIEAAAAGADAILLIAAILDIEQLRDFRQIAAEYRMAAIVEAHNQAELDKALGSGAEIVGINNRDLHTFEVNLETSIRLAPGIPPGVLRISESGIFSGIDVCRLLKARFDAFLVGEHLVKSGNAAEALRELRTSCS
jgi:indole-3-glycerol phosphate synthase